MKKFVLVLSLSVVSISPFVSYDRAVPKAHLTKMYPLGGPQAKLPRFAPDYPITAFILRYGIGLPYTAFLSFEGKKDKQGNVSWDNITRSGDGELRMSHKLNIYDAAGKVQLETTMYATGNDLKDLDEQMEIQPNFKPETPSELPNKDTSASSAQEAQRRIKAITGMKVVTPIATETFKDYFTHGVCDQFQAEGKKHKTCSFKTEFQNFYQFLDAVQNI